MRHAPHVQVTWTATETHQALIPVDELAAALSVDPTTVTPSLLTAAELTDALDSVLSDHQDDDSYQHGSTREITDARPGPARPTLAELLDDADELLDAEHAADGLTDASRLLQRRVAAVRADGAA